MAQLMGLVDAVKSTLLGDLSDYDTHAFQSNLVGKRRRELAETGTSGRIYATFETRHLRGQRASALPRRIAAGWSALKRIGEPRYDEMR